MIRSNLPLPFLYRLRLQAGSAARQAQSSLVNYRQPRLGESATRSTATRSGGSRRGVAGDSGQVWQEFIEQYERFTDILCAAAKSGCDDRKESEYARLRYWFVGHYYRLAARIRPALDAEFQQETAPFYIAPVVVDYAGQKRALDPLEALFLPVTLRDVFAQDSGDLFPRKGFPDGPTTIRQI